MRNYLPPRFCIAKVSGIIEICKPDQKQKVEWAFKIIDNSRYAGQVLKKIYLKSGHPLSALHKLTKELMQRHLRDGEKVTITNFIGKIVGLRIFPGLKKKTEIKSVYSMDQKSEAVEFFMTNEMMDEDKGMLCAFFDSSIAPCNGCVLQHYCQQQSNRLKTDLLWNPNKALARRLIKEESKNWWRVIEEPFEDFWKEYPETKVSRKNFKSFEKEFRNFYSPPPSKELKIEQSNLQRFLGICEKKAPNQRGTKWCNEQRAKLEKMIDKEWKGCKNYFSDK